LVLPLGPFGPNSGLPRNLRHHTGKTARRKDRRQAVRRIARGMLPSLSAGAFGHPGRRKMKTAARYGAAARLGWGAITPRGSPRSKAGSALHPIRRAQRRRR
jgi:hypothetical protein